MSSAIDKGLYHPRYKDDHATYFEGISDEGEPYTESERRELIEQYNAEQKSNYAKNQAEKCGRIAEYSLDAENKKVYAALAEKWRGIAEESVDKSGGSGIINKKVSDRIINLFNESDNNLFDFEEIEAEMLKSNVGCDISNFIEYENFIITMNYDLDAPPELMGDVLGKDINVYVANHNNVQEIAETIIHEAAHKKYSWDKHKKVR